MDTCTCLLTYLRFFGFGFVVFHVSFLYILVSSATTQPQSIGLWGHLHRFYCYEARFSVFDGMHACVDPVTHPSGFFEGDCKCGYPQSAQSSGKLPQIRSDSDYFRRSIYSAPPKNLPEMFLYIMDTPDSFLVSVAAEMVAFR